jgi:hypothetical protein
MRQCRLFLAMICSVLSISLKHLRVGSIVLFVTGKVWGRGISPLIVVLRSAIINICMLVLGMIVLRYGIVVIILVREHDHEYFCF